MYPLNIRCQSFLILVQSKIVRMANSLYQAMRFHSKSQEHLGQLQVTEKTTSLATVNLHVRTHDISSPKKGHEHSSRENNQIELFPARQWIHLRKT
ncbi:MAG: hypothetical protein NPIRA01_08440 [Nitrospirales bacterium]|nr:MAG: hypothetical protein NPIRA01_08440 [Nitrospirales bacterium]